MNYKKQKGCFFFAIFMLFIITSISGCSSHRNPQDPFEPFNRTMFNMNEGIDKVILKPTATIYNKIVPKPLNKGIANAYNNIDTIPTVINDILQLNFYWTARDAWRLGINSTIGILGLFDVGSYLGVKLHKNDFGLTLARWGCKNSNYLVLPFFGSSTVRDGIGIPVDYFYFSIYPHIYPPTVRYSLYALGVVQRRAQLLQLEPIFEEAALDKYVFMRDAYLQNRAYQIEQLKNSLATGNQAGLTSTSEERKSSH